MSKRRRRQQYKARCPDRTRYVCGCVTDAYHQIHRRNDRWQTVQVIAVVYAAFDQAFTCRGFGLGDRLWMLAILQID